MKHTLINLSPETITADAVVVGVYHGGQLTSAAKQIDAASGGMLSRLVSEGEIKGLYGRDKTNIVEVIKMKSIVQRRIVGQHDQQQQRHRVWH